MYDADHHVYAMRYRERKNNRGRGKLDAEPAGDTDRGEHGKDNDYQGGKHAGNRTQNKQACQMNTTRYLKWAPVPVLALAWVYLGHPN